MAGGEDPTDPEERTSSQSLLEDAPAPASTESNAESDADGEEGKVEEEEDDDDEEEEEEEEEPHLKYATLTRSLGALYKNGDATSSFLVAGDKMIVGTQKGNIFALSLPNFTILKRFHVHSASVSSVSISPITASLSGLRPDATQRLAADSVTERDRSPSSSPAGKNVRQGPVPNTVSNQIYIATSSIDGTVCIFYLVDEKDIQVRNFGRPISSVALSPEYKSDRTFLTGGRAGSLVVTVGGVVGKTTNANVSGTAAAAASGWLGSIGLGSNAGTDKILHSGEGNISTIKWSLSGKYVLWVNEHGIKVMRSHLHLSSSENDLEWKRMSHIDYPETGQWQEMSSVWRAQAEWINRDNLENEDIAFPEKSKALSANGELQNPELSQSKKIKFEEVIVGWGDAAWILRVHPGKNTTSTGVDEARLGRVEIAKIIRVDDCTISGISLYTPNVLLVLAYMERKGDQKPTDQKDKTNKVGRNRHNALEPELRLIDITTNEEIDADTLSVSRFETLSAADYHLGVLPPIKIPSHLAQRGYLGALGSGVSAIGSGIGTVSSGIYSGVETVGQGVWDATMYGPRMLGANRMFSSGESVKSGQVANDKSGSVRERNYLTGWIPGFGSSINQQSEEIMSVATTSGMKIFIFSPFDCIVAVRRTLADRLQWLVSNKKYAEAWALLEEHPEAAGSGIGSSETSPPDTPTSSTHKTIVGRSRNQADIRREATLAEFFTDSISITSASNAKRQEKSSKGEKEKRRIGELWLKQLVDAKGWAEAGEIAEKVLDTAPRWEYWIWYFIRNNKFDEISTHVPTLDLTPPLPSSIFEIILGHYVSQDTKRFKDLLDQWPSDLFEINSVTTAIQNQLKSGDVKRDSPDWQYLQECLAKLFLADGHYDDALRCYIRLQDGDTAMSLVKDHHLISAIADDIPSFVLLNIAKQQLKTCSQIELDQLSSDPIKLLVNEATHGAVEPEEVVIQLQEADLQLFLYFYLRSLWRGEGIHQTTALPKVGRQAHMANLAVDSGRALVEQFADTAVELFAEYDPPLLMEFLHASTSYTFEKAVQICEQRHNVAELVYLLSKTGQMKKALFLIINELDDVSKAISFAKEQNDPGLWDDLLDYSMSRPRFISGLLAEVGMAIDPITLVKRIPSGLEIQGLKNGLKKMIREYDLQDSLSTGVANVLMSEVGIGMDALRRGRRRGIKFDVTAGAKTTRSREIKDSVAVAVPGSFRPEKAEEEKPAEENVLPGHCVGCQKAFHVDDADTLVGFACGHVYHLSHLFREPKEDVKNGDQKGETVNTTQSPTSNTTSRLRATSVNADESVLGPTMMRSVGPKVTEARLLKDRIEAIGGCRACHLKQMKLEEVA